ncbi:type VI secretion system baseplate subunit TssF [Xenorhabdus stockiae]|uniref:type VI secretion system baseplate subunit TssF n=1 Tax=Xenorhabdus stockiae TaxID=351614 RepID=UPI001FCED508|nr:type VI secretion system baseplate subunit TssF [Xenorhabdus stockiae]
MDYLQQIEKLASKEKPHLAENFNGCDPDIERLNQGFSVLMARLHQKVDDTFPEITLPLLYPSSLKMLDFSFLSDQNRAHENYPDRCPKRSA